MLDFAWTQKQIDWLVIRGIVVKKSFGVDEGFDNFVGISYIYEIVVVHELELISFKKIHD